MNKFLTALLLFISSGIFYSALANSDTGINNASSSKKEHVGVIILSQYIARKHPNPNIKFDIIKKPKNIDFVVLGKDLKGYEMSHLHVHAQKRPKQSSSRSPIEPLIAKENT